MNKWVKACVIATFLCVFLEGLSTYRVEFPKQGAPVMMNTASPVWTLVVPGVCDALLLFASVLIAFVWKPRTLDTKGNNSKSKVGPRESEVSVPPHLHLEYQGENRDKHDMEMFVFINDSNSSLTNIQVGALTWSKERPITLHNVIGILRPKQQAECRFTPYEQRGNSQVLSTLPATLREIMRECGAEAQAKLEVRYEDMGGNKFSRSFVSSIDPWDRVVFDPGPVQSERGASEVPTLTRIASGIHGRSTPRGKDTDPRS